MTTVTTTDTSLDTPIRPAAAAPSTIAGMPIAELRRGAVEMLPMLFGYLPFALVVGAAVAQSSNPLAAWAGTWIVFGGSAQVATLHAVDNGSMLVAIATGLLVNTRLLMYSASIAPLWRQQPRWFRFAGAQVLNDPTWAAAQRRSAEPATDDDHRAYFVGAVAALSLAWGVFVAVGMIGGSGWTEGLGLTITLPLCLVAIVAPRLKDRASRLTAVAAAGAALGASGLPAGSAIIVAVVAGASVGAYIDRSSE